MTCIVCKCELFASAPASKMFYVDGKKKKKTNEKQQKHFPLRLILFHTKCQKTRSYKVLPFKAGSNP